MKTICFETVLDFGKHNGMTAAEILTEHPTYLLFLRRPRSDGSSPIAFSIDLHCALDAMLYAVGFSPSSLDKPKYPQEISDGWVKKQAERVAQEKAQQQLKEAQLTIERQHAVAAGNDTYSAWGAW